MSWRPFCLLVSAMMCLSQVTLTLGVTRKYYVAANDEEWDYAPGNTNLAHPQEQATADIYLKSAADRIGGKYVKAVYHGYSDATFTRRLAKPASLGLLGPTIRGEVGDVIEIVYFNNASQIYSMHPHGVFYHKGSEGALYLDGTSGKDKNDDVVFPGDQVTLSWEVGQEDAPGPRDPNCIPWVYHSHVNTVKDTSAGVVGTLVTCRKGILDANNERTDVDVELPLFVKIFDENISWNLEDNVQRYCQDPARCSQLADDEDYQKSNHMASVNGYMFGHLPGLTACVNQKVQFYVIGMGNEFDVHSLYFHGLNLKYQHTRGDTISVFTATFVAAETTPLMTGDWLISDVVGDNEKNGMSAIFHVTPACGATSSPPSMKAGQFKWYYLAAQSVEWDYGPGGVDHFTGKDLTDPTGPAASYFEKSSSRFGGVYTKSRFVEYTNANFSSEVTRSSHQAHLGIMGPVIRAEPGDIIQVVLKNDANHPVSFLPHGFVSHITDGPGQAGPVQPGVTFTYSFLVPAKILDGVKDDCLNFLYTSSKDGVQEYHSGLVGQILICRQGYATSNQTKPKELFLLVAHFNENESFHIDENIQNRLSVPNSDAFKSDEDFMASNIRFTVNGYSFGAFKNFTIPRDSEAVWYVGALGSDLDVHPLTFDGNAFTWLGTHRDVIGLVAGNTAALHMKPDNPGSWLVMSNSNLARDGGAYLVYRVTSCRRNRKRNRATGAQTRNGTARNYFIAAQEVEWDYTPLMRGLIDGLSLNDPRSGGNIFVKHDDEYIGNVYRKAVFREYTDFTFSTSKRRDALYSHLDILGPVVRAEVGDTITVFFKNKASRPFSIHAHGVNALHGDIGRPYNGSTAGVDPGKIFIYSWHVPERSGPGPNDPNCIPWLYYSAVNPTKDTNSGLVGPLIVCRPGTLDQNNNRKDMDREMFLYMSVINENLSWYLDASINLFAPSRAGTDYGSDPEFEESNKMHSVNGRLFGNNPGLVLEYNASVTWYFMALGQEIDLHTMHTHGNTFVHSSNGHRDDVLSVFPTMAEAVFMKAVNPGTWLLHCHVLDHIAAGMETTYTVLPEGKSIPPEGSDANIHVG